MNILIITDKLYPDETGGSCTYAYYTSIELKRLGNNVSIFTSYPENRNNDSYFKGIHVYRKLNKKSILRSSLELLRIILKERYDTILFHSPISWLIYFIIKRKVNNDSIRTIGIYHGPWYKEADLKYRSNKNFVKTTLVFLRKIIEKKYLHDVDHFIFLSKYMKNELRKINQKANFDYKIIPGGVDLNKLHRKYSKEEARKILKLKEDSFVIFSLRRLEYRMGIQNAMDAIKKLNSRNVIYMIGGKGPFEKFLKTKASKENISCRFEGYIPDEKLEIYYCASDLFLVPSIDLEGFGLVILESLSIGIPVLTTPQGGMKELVGRLKNLYVTADTTSSSICAKIVQLFEENKLKEIKQDANIKNYSWNNISKQINNYLNSLD